TLCGVQSRFANWFVDRRRLCVGCPGEDNPIGGSCQRRRRPCRIFTRASGRTRGYGIRTTIWKEWSASSRCPPSERSSLGHNEYLHSGCLRETVEKMMEFSERGIYIQYVL